MTSKKERLLYVEWDDHSSFGSSGWRGKDEYESGNKPLRCASVGWVVAESRDAITLVGTKGGSKYSGDMTILKNCIRKKRRL